MNTKYRLKYAGAHGKGVTVYLDEDPRKGVCEACGRSVKRGEIKNTALHHFCYKYKPETVKKNPKLALENTVELCFSCHRIADALRNLFSVKNDETILKVLLLMPPEMRERFVGLARRMGEKFK
jgi:hypothetical protein